MGALGHPPVDQPGLGQLEELEVRPGLGSSTTGYVPVWNRSVSSPLLLVFMGDNNNASDGPLVEVAKRAFAKGRKA